MILDASTFELSLTPEIALSIIQKSVNSKGWKKYEVSSIKLLYSPFYIFSFDIAAEGQAPSGKAALNAYTGELNDFVPVLLDRPLKRSRSTADKTQAEVEPSAISAAEVKEVAAVKVASFTGVAKEKVTISAINKLYVPFYRIWVNVANDTFKIDVDASLGAPIGLEAIPARQKGWEEATAETVEKMKSPGGWVELGSKTVQEAGKIASGGGGRGGKGPFGNKAQIAVLIVIVILVLYVFVFRGSTGNVLGGNSGFACAPEATYLSAGGFMKSPSLVPEDIGNGWAEVVGSCNFTNPGKETVSSCVSIRLKADGKATKAYKVINVMIGSGQIAPKVVPFTLNWTTEDVPQAKAYELAFEKVC